MLFKDVKQNTPVYILDKQEFKVIQTKAVKDAGYPYKDPKSSSPSVFGQSNMVIDVTIELNGKTPTFTIPENLSIAYAGDLVLTTNPDHIIREIENMRNTAKRALSPEVQEYNKKIVAESDKLLSDVSPAHKERIQAEQRMSDFESNLNSMKKEMSDVKKMLSDFIGEFKK